jgi:peptidylprolyl isomerase
MIEPGTNVKVHYKGTLDDGSIFDSSEGKEPLSFQAGTGQVIPGFDETVLQMEVGASATVTIPSEKAYGSIREDMILTLGKEQFPEGMEPKVGNSLKLSTPQGPLIARITDINNDGVVIDGNHPLAGKDLTFELTLIEAG